MMVSLTQMSLEGMVDIGRSGVQVAVSNRHGPC